jgi:hypothetical protein
MSGGEKSEANCTAAKMAAKSNQTASVEGACWGRSMVFVSSLDSEVIAELAIQLRITVELPNCCEAGLGVSCGR